MSTKVSGNALVLFSEGKFFEGLALFCADRIEKHGRTALDAATWDDNLLAKGAKAEVKVFMQLQVDVEKFVADHRAAAKK